MKARILSCVILAGAVSLLLLGAETPQTLVTKEDYLNLTRWRFAAGQTPVPSEGLTITKDTAVWTLQTGNVRLMEPTGNGMVTGLVFEGKGRFVMTIPDRFEREQLRRFSGQPGLEMLDVPFTRLVLRTSSKMLAPYAADKSPGGFEKNECATARHESWLKTGDLDADARIMAGLLTPGDDYLIVDAETPEFGWLMYEYDPFCQEEITLTKLQKENNFAETWVSLDRPEERDSQGRPTSARKRAIDVTNAAIEIDLRDTSSKTLDRQPERAWVHFKARLNFLPLIEGARALHLRLDPLAKVKSVSRGDGTEVPFLRDATGKRFASMDNEVNNSALTVLLEGPTQMGASQELVFDYDMKLYNYASGRDWYPGEADVLDDPHTGRLTFTMPKKYQVRAVGVPEEVKPSAEGQIAVWNVVKPVKMLGFSYGQGFSDEKIQLPGLPEIDSFGTESGFTTGNMVRNVAADVVNSLNFYQQYFGVKLATDRIYAARIMGYHGQAFDGFLHLSFLTYDAEHTGSSELFRAHEAAHQYWGHLVGWKSYRDQWISEAFAQYSALMFIQASMKGKGVFEKFLSEFTDELTGQSMSMDSLYLRGLGLIPTKKQRQRIGPIAAGSRASTAEVPNGYVMQVYDKGALVLHMIRQICWAAVRDRDAFRETLQDFLRTFSGREAGTVDFLRLLQKHTGLDWMPFFENWVYGTAIPTYTWSYQVGDSPDPDGRYPCSLKIAQADVPAGFSATVPVRFEFGSDKWSYLWLTVDEPTRTFDCPLAGKPKKVTFNPNFSVLARVKKN
jgi:hypothetical protein